MSMCVLEGAGCVMGVTAKTVLYSSVIQWVELGMFGCVIMC